MARASGAAPIHGSLHDRLAYLSPAVGRRAFDAAGIAYREESAFQGGDGLSAVRHAGPRRVGHPAHRRFRPRQDRGGATTRSIRTPTSPPISSPPSGRAWRNWSRIRGYGRHARHLRPGADRPHRLPARPPGKATVRAVPPSSATRGNCGRFPITRSSSSSAGAPIRCRVLDWPPAATPDAVSELRRTSPRFRRAMDFALARAAAFAPRRAARGGRDARPRHLVGIVPGTAAFPAAREGADGGRGRAGAARHLVRGAGDVPARPCRPSGAAGGLAGRSDDAPSARCCCMRCGSPASTGFGF